MTTLVSPRVDEKQDVRNPLPGVPKIESPFFNRFFKPGDKNYDVAKALHDDGYAIIDFPDPDFDRLADDIITDLAPRYDWSAWKAHGQRGPRISHAYKFNASVKKIATNAAVMRLLSELYGRRAMPFQTLNFPIGTQQPYHTDSVHFSCLPERFMCGVWVALEDVGEDNGPLMYFPGSHKLPIYLNEHIGKRRDPVSDKYATYDRYVEFWRELVEELGLKYELLSIKKGQAVIWCANLLHGGALQRDKDRTRHSQVTHYYFEGCTYYVPVNSEQIMGEVYYHKFRNVATGEPMVNMSDDRAVPPAYIEFCDVTERDLAAGARAKESAD